MSLSKKRKISFWWRLFLFCAFIFVALWCFKGCFPNTAHRAKEAAIEWIADIDGERGNNSSTVKTDSLTVLPKIVEERTIQPITIVKDSSVVVPIEVSETATYIIANINGADIKFQLDTGCSGIQITMVEFMFLEHNGLATLNDIEEEKVTCSYANGDKKECHVFKAKKVEIGGVVVNDVTCTIEEKTDSPRLLGQSVLQKMGKVTIDYRNKQLIIDK